MSIEQFYRAALIAIQYYPNPAEIVADFDTGRMCILYKDPFDRSTYKTKIEELGLRLGDDRIFAAVDDFPTFYGKGLVQTVDFRVVNR